MGNSNRGYTDYYVYTFAYPQSMGGAVFYAGKGRTWRIDDHEREARRGHQCQKCEIIRSIWLAGKQVVKMKIAMGLSETEALQLEKETINSTDTLINNHMKNTYKAATPEWRARRSLEAKQKWDELKTSSWWKNRHP